MYLTFIILITICCVLLVLVVLAQNPKGGGLSAEFGGSGSSQMMGVKRTTDLLEKLTWGFAVAILVLSLAANMALPRNNTIEEGPTSINTERAKEIPVQQPQQQQQPVPGEENGGLSPEAEEEEN